jgi:hypothetical protein
VQADLGLCFCIDPIGLILFPCYAHIPDAPPFTGGAATSTVRLVRFLRLGSLPTAFLYGAEFHTSCRAARCDHECVSYGRTYSSNDRSRASRIACCGVLRFAAGSLPQIFTNTQQRALVPHTWRFTRLSRAAWFQTSVPDAPREDASGAS